MHMIIALVHIKGKITMEETILPLLVLKCWAIEEDEEELGEVDIQGRN